MIDLLCVRCDAKMSVANYQAAPVCHTCGNKHVRRAGRHARDPDVPDANVDAPRLVVAVEEGCHKAGDGDTWLGSPKRFVEFVTTREPGMSEAELVRCTSAWFGPKEQSHGR